MSLPVYLSSQGKRLRIRSKEAFSELFSPRCKAPFIEQINAADQRIRRDAPNISQGALSNVHGAWYEWILGFHFWNHFVENGGGILAVKLPNVSSFDVADLFEKDLRDYIFDLRQKVAKASNVELVTSNPDFFLCDVGQKNFSALRDRGPMTDYSSENIVFLDNLFKSLTGFCNLDNIEGFMASKTSFRPDRRLQIPHEGSLMKAIYAHLVTRDWILSPRGLKYYAVACKVGEPDRRALKTVATHSIVTVADLPKAAVDEVFEVNDSGGLRRFLETALVNHR